MNLTRARMLTLVASSVALARCGSRAPSVRVGSKNFTESFLIAEIYAQALEAAGLRVERRFNLGSTQIAMAAIARGDIDLYPEYTGTALIDVLHRKPLSDPREVYAVVSDAFKQRYGLVWLTPSPMNDSQALATTQAIAQRERLSTLSDLASKASHLRLATIQEFLSRADGLPGLQRAYGGFRFAQVRTYDIALKYRALLSGKADVASAFTTDGAIATDRLVVLRDDRHLWPPYNVAPVVRQAALEAHPQIASVLDAVSPGITDARAQSMNAAVESGQDPSDVAAAFLAGRKRGHSSTR
ncbi:MAG TPA: glycine betaine ABC transporter substrate-binding protein [Candidatus Baltobacteraceae bacterium]|nr:glycine betaine ABC transporter substrate-binding protein [Candidatus Baltobacteraceae bacterium]